MSTKNQYLTDILELTTEKFPNRTAIRDKYSNYSYKELHDNSIRIAKNLKLHGVKLNDQVALLTRKDTLSIMCFWGIIYSGGIPVLLDENEGLIVNKNKIDSFHPSHILLNEIDKAEVKGWGDFKILKSSELTDTEDSLEKDRLDERAEICYMTTTSGTTGTPKVIQVTHKNVIHYTKNFYKILDTNDQLNSAHVTNFSTDLGHTNILMSLISGGMLRILNSDESKDPELFKTIIEEEDINFLKTTPSHINAIIPFFSSHNKINVNYIVLGGEKLPWTLVDAIRNKIVFKNIYNHYGPSETTVGALVYKISDVIDSSESVPIGSPIGEGDVYLVNEKNHIGELYIEGPGVSMGYYNNKVDTKSKFFFNKKSNKYGYKTGDICKKLVNGTFIFLNRNDNQVKIRGHRVELDEIEQIINKHPKVEYAVLNTYRNDNENVIESYVKPNTGNGISMEDLYYWLKEQLPSYKIPEHIYIGDSCPYTGNGKIDFKTLRRKTKLRNRGNSSETVDWNSWEDSVKYCWEEALGVIYEDQHFFESGGNSLNAIKLIGKLQMNGYNVNLFDLNNNPLFSEFISLKREKREEIEKEENTIGGQNLTSSQFQFFKCNQKNLDQYSQTVLLEVKGELDTNTLALAIEETINSHSELSLKFIKISEDVYTEESNASNPPLSVYQLNKKLSVTNQITKITQEILSTISVSSGITFRVGLIKGELKEQNYLFLACHHLIIDAISWDLILNKILSSYEDISKGKQKGTKKETIRNQFYKKLLIENRLPSLHYPKGLSEKIKKLPFIQSKKQSELSVVTISLDDKLSMVLKNLKKTKNSLERINEILLRCFVDTLFDFYTLEELSMDIEFYGRPQVNKTVDLSSSVSWWSTTFPVDFNQENKAAEKIKTLVDEVSVFANNINAHPDIYTSYKKLKSDVRFNYLGEFPEYYGNSSFNLYPSSISSYSTRNEDSNREYKLFFTSRFIDNNFVADIQYCKSAVSDSDAYTIANNFIKKLTQKPFFKDISDIDNSINIHRSNVPSIGKSLYRTPKQNFKGRSVKNIFLTGATGYLGAYLLRELLIEGVHVFCLVRSYDRESAYQKLNSILEHYFPEEDLSKRSNITLVLGDLSENYFGLDFNSYTDLCDSVDSIVHCAADINLTKSYKDLHRSNIFGTEQIIKLAHTGIKKTLHYVSTLAVSGISSRDSSEFSEKTFDIGQSFLSGYEKSKFDAEKLVRNALDKGLECKIYRVGHIAANSVTGKFQKNAGENRIIQLLEGMMILGKIPVSYNEKVSFSHVDVVSKMMSNVVTGRINTDLNCIHLENTAYYSIRELLPILKKMGYAVKIVNDEEFKSAVLAFKGSIYENERIDMFKIWINRYISQKRNIEYLSTESNDLFGNYGLVFPELKDDWLISLIIEELFNNKAKASKNLNLVEVD